MSDYTHHRSLWKQSREHKGLCGAPRIYNPSLKIVSCLEIVARVAVPKWWRSMNQGTEMRREPGTKKGPVEVSVGEEC